MFTFFFCSKVHGCGANSCLPKTLTERFGLYKVPIDLLGEPVRECIEADCLLWANILEPRWEQDLPLNF